MFADVSSTHRHNGIRLCIRIRVLEHRTGRFKVSSEDSALHGVLFGTRSHRTPRATKRDDYRSFSRYQEKQSFRMRLWKLLAGPAP
jgi:hypothetical protein